MTDLKKTTHSKFFQTENTTLSNNIPMLTPLKKEWENETERLKTIKLRIITAINTTNEKLSSEKTTPFERQHHENEQKKHPALLTEVERQLTLCKEKLDQINQILQSSNNRNTRASSLFSVE